MTTDEDQFLQDILEERDRLFRETVKLKSQVDGYSGFEAERASYEKTIIEKDEKISKLLRQVEILQRRIWGKSSERFIQENPLQRSLDFDGLDLLPEEEQLATSAKEEIEEYKTIRVIVKTKSQPVRKPLPENLPREDYHVYPENIDKENWVELEPEITEILEHEPARFYVRRIIRHK